MKPIVLKLNEKFTSLFGETPLMVKSPGRINLIGEHTDYNNGFVLPAAIDKGVYVAVTKRNDNLIKLFSLDFSEALDTSLEEVKPTDKGWPNYILGVVAQIQKKGMHIGGFNLCIDGDLPIGAGLSSSAAVECATLFALNEIFALGFDKKDIALMAQKAEHEFAGVKCGIMDQFASVFGKAGHVVKLDCRSLDYEYVPFDYDDIEIALFDTQIKHQLASSEYNLRRAECEKGVAEIQNKHPHVQSLRDANEEMVNECLEKDSSTYRKCLYVVQEIKRLQDGCEDLRAHNLASFGNRMIATHDGLSKLYEVSCAELDFLVDEVRGNPDVIGARMMGGGFGGCTINLIKKEKAQEIFEALKQAYHQKFNKELYCYMVKADDGTKVLNY